VEGHASISNEVLASYAGDAAAEVAQVTGLVESALHRQRGARVTGEDGAVRVEVHVEVAWGTDIAAAGEEVQLRVTEVLQRMAGVTPAAVDVVVAAVAAPPDGTAP
jgi:uncharacterized alkaline shock family protein YloU